MHKSSKNIPELTGSKSDPLKPCTIAIDTDWNINDLEQFFPVINRHFLHIVLHQSRHNMAEMLLRLAFDTNQSINLYIKNNEAYIGFQYVLTI
jgi:hypothetical protein